MPSACWISGSGRRARRKGPASARFGSQPEFDAALRREFLGDHQRAAACELMGWRAAPEPCLALILLLDQLPRNLFRGSARAFATDTLALDTARHAVASGFDRVLPPVWRWFVYLPFEHSEALADQEMSIRLYAALPEDADKPRLLDYCRRHHEIIARFGRFPHRNRALSRPTTPEEEAFLREPGSAF